MNFSIVIRLIKKARKTSKRLEFKKPSGSVYCDLIYGGEGCEFNFHLDLRA